VAVNALSPPEFDFIEQFCWESVTLPEIIAQREEIEASRDDKRWVIIDGIIVCNGRIFMLVLSVVWRRYWNMPKAWAMKERKRPYTGSA
jgi:hypothetical protein